jgi:hypothetical protein
MSEHLVTRREARHLFAKGDDDAGRLDPERQRGLQTDIPATDSDDLVPITTPAARTAITTSSGARDRGAASSSICTSPPNASMPAARISRPFPPTPLP